MPADSSPFFALAAAALLLAAADWVDYMQMGRVDGRWVIVNVLWETRPRR